jgi:hypothetical protein
MFSQLSSAAVTAFKESVEVPKVSLPSTAEFGPSSKVEWVEDLDHGGVPVYNVIPRDDADIASVIGEPVLRDTR